MHAHDGRIDHLHLAVMSGDDGVHQPIPNTGLSPTIEAVVDRGRRAIALRHICPRRAGPENPENAVENTPVIDPRHPAWLVRQQRLDRSPLKLSQIVARHRQGSFRNLESFSPNFGSRL